MENNFFLNFAYLILGILLMFIIVPIVRIIAIKLNIIDIPKGRKIHKVPTPLLGGLAIFIGFNLMLIITKEYNNCLFSGNLFFVSLALLIVGTIDDIFDLPAKFKLCLQIIIAICAAIILGGIDSIQIYKFVFHFNQFFGILLQALWIVVLINAFNLIDGLDGLATGCSLISITTIAIVSFIRLDYATITICCILIGILLGFLKFNFVPAKIFLGDGGSMLLGFYIAILSFNEYKTVTLTAMVAIILIAFLPIFDVCLSFVRRKVNGQSAFKPDALHFHHRLLKHGFSVKQSVLIIYAIMMVYAIASIIISVSNSYVKIIIFLALIIFTVFVIEKLYLLSDKHAYISKFIHKHFK